MKRTAIIDIGDWGDDGHGKHVSAIVKLVGDDVSNERMQQAYKDAVNATEIDIQEILSEFEENRIDADGFERLCEYGLKIHKFDDKVVDDKRIWVTDFFSNRYYEEYDFNTETDALSARNLLMFYLGYGIENFEYKFVNLERIIGTGANKSPLHEFGYGLFVS